jgi:flagellar basal body rod protein FlgF
MHNYPTMKSQENPDISQGKTQLTAMSIDTAIDKDHS